MNRTELLICGFGGQGVIFAAELLGRTAVLAGMEVAQSVSYGSEARGSACHAGVVLASEEIAYPKVRTPDILVALSQSGYDKFISSVKAGAKVIYEKDLVVSCVVEGIEQIGIPATSIAVDLGNRNVANVVMLGAVVKQTGIVPETTLRQTLDEHCPPKYLEINRQALEKGINA